MAADANAGHVGNSDVAVTHNPDNLCPSERPDYNPANYTSQPGAAARANHYPRLS